jgi:hypothetical protein
MPSFDFHKQQKRPLTFGSKSDSDIRHDVEKVVASTTSLANSGEYLSARKTLRSGLRQLVADHCHSDRQWRLMRPVVMLLAESVQWPGTPLPGGPTKNAATEAALADWSAWVDG